MPAMLADVQIARSGGAPAGAAALVVAMAAALVVSAPAAAEGGRVVVALSPPAVESNRFWETTGDFGLNPALDRLVGNDPETGDYVNTGLAESWEANEDFTEWTFHLHQGVPWHFDYGEVSAQDVVHSYELHTQEAATITGLDQLLGAMVEAVDDHTVRFTYDNPRPDFLFALAERGVMLIYSKAQHDQEGIEGYDRRPAGTGPYRYVERSLGERLLFERVEDHWSGRAPDFEELEVRWVAEPATKLAMLLTGEAHIADLPRELQPDALAQGLEIIASRLPAMQTFYTLNGLYQRSGDPAHRPDLPWADVRVREAMNRAIDRGELLEVLYDGRAERLARFTMHPPHEGYEPSLEERFEEHYGYDPERARELLAEAGYPDAFTDPIIPLAYVVLPGSAEWPTMTELVQVYFQAIGLQAEIREMDWAAIGALGRGREAYLLHPGRNAPIRPTEVGLVNFYTSRGTPYGGFEDDTIEGLIDRLGTTVDPQERDRIAREAFTYLFEAYADIPIAAISAEVVINPEVVADWVFPGVASIGVSHFHLIEAAAR
jgi:peptide/nickel transport system substrate-binding protein